MQTDQEIRVLQDFYGYCLQKNVLFSRFLVLAGPCGGVKSLAAWLLRELVGPDKCAGVMPEDLADRAELARLKDRYVNVCPVADPYALLSPAFMSILSGDRLLAEDDRGEGFIFSPSCKFVFTAVGLPRDVLNDRRFESRGLMARFRKTKARVEERRLTDRLLAELPGIREWARQGLNRLVRNKGFTGYGRDLGDHSRAFVPRAPDPGPGPGFFPAYAEPAFLTERDYSLEGVY
ncbi:MAG TPA: hypothetical protein DHV36_22165 [Desulfobacteraceae bacterium]|nr:hypothetical protein [Desulfobacteraceae bacterium]